MKIKNIHKAQIITQSDLQKRRRVLPMSLSKAAGILSGQKRKVLEKYINSLDLEWDRSARA